jgi:hypothetical protein
MRRLITTTTALLALSAPLLVMGAASAAPVEVAIKPGTIKRGPDIADVHLDGTTIVDGDIKVPLKAKKAMLYGRWGKYYIVATGDSGWGNVRLLRVAPSGGTKLIREFVDPFNTVLDSDAGQVAYSMGDATQKPVIEVYDLQQKEEVAVNSFGSLPQVLDFDEGIVVASFWSFRVKTITWNTVSDDTVKVNRKRSNYASVVHNLLGFYSKDPYNGGCQVLARLDDLNVVRWNSCDERIDAVSPDGKRVATIPLLSDGIGPADVIVRKIGGAPLAHYTIGGYFGRVWWETSTALLMEANGRTQAAVVRCDLAICDRATDLTAPPDL